MAQRSGKVLTAFVIIGAVLLVTSTALAIFFFRLEIHSRKTAESKLADILKKESTLNIQIADYKKQISLLEQKNKEADDQINSLLDEVELEKGLREEMKKESNSLREELDKEKQQKDKIKDQLNKLQEKYDSTMADYEKKVKEQLNLNDELKKQINQSAVPSLPQANDLPRNPDSSSLEKSVNLEKIVVAPTTSLEGQVINVDTGSEFVIIDVGAVQGITEGQIFNVIHNDQSVGDIKVTRVQQELSAADLIPPLSIQQIQKSDKVVLKK